MNIEDWNIILGVLEVAEENAAHRLEEEKQSRLAAVRAVRIERLGEELMRIRRAIRKVKAANAWHRQCNMDSQKRLRGNKHG